MRNEIFLRYSLITKSFTQNLKKRDVSIKEKKVKDQIRKINENPSKVKRNTSPRERWKNYAKRKQWQTKSAKLTCYPKKSIIIDLKISKHRFNRSDEKVTFLASENNRLTVWIV